ncbi:MAG: hypothetical protein OXH15_14885 [Gammaproteobacteria bacterium]|nr:hypothetical protein [Gammaproteobacteria bacterium]
MTKSDDAQETLLVKLHEALSSSRQWLDHTHLPAAAQDFGDKDLFSLKAFTDNIAIGWPLYDRRDGEGELGMAFGDLAGFQLTMVNAGFFVRGAISVGNAYVDEIAVFGDALLEAYVGESTLARDPRIVLTESAREHVVRHLGYYGNSSWAPQNRDLVQDIDGQWFLNYLDAILWGEDRGGPFFDELEKHRDAVQSRLNEHRARPTVYAKYAWTAGYHNWFCDQHGFEDYKIDVDALSGSRGFIVDNL